MAAGNADSRGDYFDSMHNDNAGHRLGRSSRELSETFQIHTVFHWLPVILICDVLVNDSRFAIFLLAPRTLSYCMLSNRTESDRIALESHSNAGHKVRA